MKIAVIALDKSAKVFEEAVQKIARRQARFLPKNGSLEVYLVSAKRMRRLNKMFRKKDKSTNVLSFQKPEGFPGKELGEVYLDPLYIKNRKEDLALMLAHGVLHILGYDHEKRSDRIRMEKKEAELLSLL